MWGVSHLGLNTMSNEGDLLLMLEKSTESLKGYSTD